jgi:hypothetical protein
MQYTHLFFGAEKLRKDNCQLLKITPFFETTSYICPLQVIIHRMSRLFTSAHSILGVIEEIDTCKIHPSVCRIRRSPDDEVEDLARSILQKGLLQSRELVLKEGIKHTTLLSGRAIIARAR